MLSIMPTLPILTHPAPTLRERSLEVDPATIGTPDFQALLDILIETMFAADGVGIAAPQVGQNIRVFAVNRHGRGEIFINPRLLKISKATTLVEEGCLSVPEVWGMVERAKKVTVEALNRHGRRVTLDCKGQEAVTFQHETDHLDGILFIDKVIQKESNKS